jgi:hypothetical protein
MAESGDNASSWPGLIGQINSAFMLVRDAFGYGLPGAVFLTIGVIAKNRCSECTGFSLQQVKDFVPFAVPAWVGFLAMIAACYAAGTVMAATVYTPISLIKYIIWMLDRHVADCDVTNTTEAAITFGKTTIQRGEVLSVSREQLKTLPAGVVTKDLDEGTWRDWLFSNPTEVTPEVLKLRVTHPELLNTLDRRETLNVMGGSMAAALLAGYYVFYVWHLSFSQIICWSGCIMLLQFLTGLSHLRRVLRAIHKVDLPDCPASPDRTKLLTDVAAASTAALQKLGK